MGRRSYHEDLGILARLQREGEFADVPEPGNDGRIEFERGVFYSPTAIAIAYEGLTRKNDILSIMVNFYKLVNAGDPRVSVIGVVDEHGERHEIAVAMGEAVPDFLAKHLRRTARVEGEEDRTYRSGSMASYKATSEFLGASL